MRQQGTQNARLNHSRIQEYRGGISSQRWQTIRSRRVTLLLMVLTTVQPILEEIYWKSWYATYLAYMNHHHHVLLPPYERHGSWSRRYGDYRSG